MNQNQSQTTRKGFKKFIREPERYPLQLSKRDLGILHLIYDYRFIPSDHVTNLIDGSERKILERLQKLFHHGYLDRLPDYTIRTRSGSEKMTYAITKKAADLLSEELGTELSKINWAYRNKTVTDRHIKHTLMIGKVRTAVTLAVRNDGEAGLMFWKENRGTGKSIDPEFSDKVKIELPGGREEQRRIVPDAFFALEDSQYEHFFYLEADRSTMTNDRFMKKLKAYWTWWKQGGSQKKHKIEGFRVLTVTRSEQRRDNLREVAKQASPGKTGSGMFWFACEKDYSIDNPESILGEIWLTSKDNQRHALLE